MKITIALFFVLIPTLSFTQIKVGDNSSNFHEDALIEIESTNKGFILPRLNLSSTTSSSPLTSHVKGMLVYNKSTSNDLSPGLYYNNGTNWKKIENSNGDISTTINQLLITDEINLEGNAGGNAKIQKNASNGRDELQLYSAGDAWSTNSKGAGMHLYGNYDNKHAGNVSFLTGPDDQGNGRMIISGAAYNVPEEEGGPRNNTDTRVTIGNGIFNWVDEQNDTGLLNLKNPDSNPAIYILENSGPNEGSIAVPPTESLTLGHWDTINLEFITNLEINSEGNVGIGSSSTTDKLQVNGSIRLENSSDNPQAIVGQSGIFSDNGELYSFDQNGNYTNISPHRFELLEQSEDLAWAFYSRNKTNDIINVDMLKVIRIVENISGQKLVFTNTDCDEINSDNISIIESLQQKIEELEKRLKAIENKSR